MEHKKPVSQLHCAEAVAYHMAVQLWASTKNSFPTMHDSAFFDLVKTCVNCLEGEKRTAATR